MIAKRKSTFRFQLFAKRHDKFGESQFAAMLVRTEARIVLESAARATITLSFVLFGPLNRGIFRYLIQGYPNRIIQGDFFEFTLGRKSLDPLFHERKPSV